MHDYDIPYKVEWESEGIMDSLDVKARITNLEGDFSLEIVARNEESFLKRLKTALKYLFKNASVIYALVPLDEKDIERLKEVAEDVRRKNS